METRLLGACDQTDRSTQRTQFALLFPLPYNGKLGAQWCRMLDLLLQLDFLFPLQLLEVRNKVRAGF